MIEHLFDITTIDQHVQHLERGDIEAGGIDGFKGTCRVIGEAQCAVRATGNRQTVGILNVSQGQRHVVAENDGLERAQIIVCRQHDAFGQRDGARRGGDAGQIETIVHVGLGQVSDVDRAIAGDGARAIQLLELRGSEVERGALRDDQAVNAGEVGARIERDHGLIDDGDVA